MPKINENYIESKGKVKRIKGKKRMKEFERKKVKRKKSQKNKSKMKPN